MVLTALANPYTYHLIKSLYNLPELQIATFIMLPKDTAVVSIGELRSGMNNVTVQGSVVSISEARTVNLKTGGTAKVADCIIKDDTGQIKLSLWEDQIAMVKAGSKIEVENGYVRSFKGEHSLNVGKYGKLKIIEY